MNDATVFVDFLDINKSHRKKTYQNTDDYSKLASVLNEFQMKLNSTSLEVKMYTIYKNIRSTVYVYIYIFIHAHIYMYIHIHVYQIKYFKVCMCLRERSGKKRALRF